jgi:hypothetical protein
MIKNMQTRPPEWLPTFKEDLLGKAESHRDSFLEFTKCIFVLNKRAEEAFREVNRYTARKRGDAPVDTPRYSTCPAC